MSGVYIKGIPEPRYCADCPFFDGTDTIDGMCRAAGKWFDDEFFLWCIYTDGDADLGKPINCPLIPVPPHGDLIDRDELIKDGWSNLYKEVMRMGGYAIHELPLKNPSIHVIIPADKDGET